MKRSFDVQKAERYFKERGIRYQYVDLGRKPLSARELDSISAAVGLDALIDTQGKLYAGSLLRYTNGEAHKKEQLLADMRLLRAPIVRNGREATVGYQPEIWARWQ